MQKVITRFHGVQMALVVVGLVMQVSAADPGRILKSAVLPGMGQLGDEQTFKGLVLLAGEVTWVTLAVSQFAGSNAYARETEYLSVQYKMAGSFKEKMEIQSFWTDAHQKSIKSKNLGIAFLGGAVVWWGLNIVDAILFPPGENNQSMIDNAGKHVRFAVNADKVEVGYHFEF